MATRQYHFSGESLVEAMLEVSGYNVYQFEFSNEEIKKLQIAGLFKTADINSLLVSLESNFDVIYEKMSHNRMRLSKKAVE